MILIMELKTFPSSQYVFVHMNLGEFFQISSIVLNVSRSDHVIDKF